MAVLLLHLLILLGVGIPAYLSNHSPFLRELSSMGFNEFPSLVCWCIVTDNRGLLYFFQRVRWDFMCVHCDVCTDTGPPIASPILED